MAANLKERLAETSGPALVRLVCERLEQAHRDGMEAAVEMLHQVNRATIGAYPIVPAERSHDYALRIMEAPE